jgi:RNA polymerase sigma-70 factor (ECF subfamily)
MPEIATDEEAYRRQVEPHRAELHAHCYRILGSVHEAEDALQEALVRAWRGMDRFEGRSSLRSWLYRVATNVCLDEVERRPRRALPVDFGPSADPHDSPGAPLVESVWVEPYADAALDYEQRETVELAFVAALQHLPPNQRAALILREVLGFSAKEVAETLDTTVASVNSALQRAREAVETRVPERSQQATLRELGDDRLRALVQDYTTALQSGEVDRVVALLTEDAAWSMPPLPGWFSGREAVAGFLAGYPLQERWRHVPTTANGQLAIGCYMWDEARQTYPAAVLDVLTLRGDRVAQVTGFIAPWVFARFGEADGVMTPEAFARFGLPAEVAG